LTYRVCECWRVVVGLLVGPLVAELLLLLGLLLLLLLGLVLLVLVGRVLLGLLLLGMVGLHLVGLHLVGLHLLGLHLLGLLLGHLGERYQWWYCRPVGEALGRGHWGRIEGGPVSDIPHTEVERGHLEFAELV